MPAIAEITELLCCNKHPEHTVVAAHNNFTLTVAVEKKMRSHSQNPAEE
jgi:hypothetical protein